MRAYDILVFLGYLYCGHVVHVAPRVTLIRFCFWSETISFIPVSVPFILNGKSLNI